MGSPVRAFGRLTVYALFTVLAMPAQILALWLSRPLSIRIPILYHRICCRILGFRVVVNGAMSAKLPTLFVSNHSSYIDVMVLASLIPGSFVAKAEVATWPFFGRLAKLQRTIFVDRRVSRAADQRDQMLKRLRARENLILFPEGTSNDGTRPLPFKSALFAVAQGDVGGEKLVVQPVSVAYTRLDGMPVGRAFRAHFAWYGDMMLMPHMWILTGLGVVTVEVMFHPPVSIAGFGTRKALADHCFNEVMQGVAAANAGIPMERRDGAAAGQS